MKEDFIVSVMCATGGPERQYVMTELMTKQNAEDRISVYADCIHCGRCFKVGGTWVNPSAVITMRVVRDNGRKVDVWDDDDDDGRCGY